MTPADQAIASLEREYGQFCSVGGLGSAELYRLGSLANDVAAERRGPHRVVAYVLRSVLFDLAEKADGAPITPSLADSFFAGMDQSIRNVLASLNSPMAVEHSVVLADQLLDARSALIKQIGGIPD